MFRMTVEDVFVIARRGVVLTGRVESGTLTVGDDVVVNGERSIRVQAIESFRKQRSEATVGDTIGVLVAGSDKGRFARGDVLTSADGWTESGDSASPLTVFT